MTATERLEKALEHINEAGLCVEFTLQKHGLVALDREALILTEKLLKAAKEKLTKLLNE